MNLVYLYYKVAFKPKMGASWFINSSMGKQCLGSTYQVLKIRLRNQQGKSWSTSPGAQDWRRMAELQGNRRSETNAFEN